MRRYRPYTFKKVYLDEEIFEVEGSEIRVGYLNINGLMDGGHVEYLNADHNLLNLDILVIAETKLDKTFKSEQIKSKLSNWNLIGGYDSNEGSKHMGLMLLTSRKSVVAE